MSKRIVIVGAGGLGREVLALVRALPEWEPIGFLDDNIPKGTTIAGLSILGNVSDAGRLEGKPAFVIAIGEPRTKRAIAESLMASGCVFPVLVHPAAVLMNRQTISIEHGTVIGAGVALTTDIQIGPHVLLNLNATVGHDVKIGAFSSIMPGVNLAGAVEIGTEALIGAGANLRNGVRVGNGAIVGMGAAVIRNVDNHSTVVGVPARAIRNHKGHADGS